MKLDLGLLTKRINDQKEEVCFYTNAVEMLLNKYNTHKLFKQHQLEFKMSMLPQNFQECFLEGVIPPDDVMNRCSISKLDDFIQEALYLLGSIAGIGYLEHQRQEQPDSSDDYIDFILMTTQNPDFCIQAMGFSAWTLLSERVPSGPMLERMFPYTKSKEQNQISANLIAEMHSDIVMKYIIEKDLELPTITRHGIKPK